mmetsp:Transcript_44134/g.42848  ORF Transcript_44134/g.42848 Transcript_44134/m.42848 type:complete len:115 (-) Transcript_44134:330-674(-)
MQKAYLFPKNEDEKKINAAVKRALKAVIHQIERDNPTQLYYNQHQSQILYEIFELKNQENNFEMGELQEIIKGFSKLYQKRPLTFMKLLDHNVDLVQILCAQYLRLLKSSEPRV